MDNIPFVATGYFTKQREGTFSITVLTPSELQIIEVLGNTKAVAQQIAAGTPIPEVTADISSMRKLESTIPLERIRSLRWLKQETGLRVSFDDEQGRNRSKTTYIQKHAIRLKLVDLMEQVIGHEFQRREEPAGFWKLAWAQVFGAALSVAGVVAIELLWDPQMIAQVRNGWIVLKLGRVGCALVGLAFLVGCFVSAWRRLHPRPIEYHCIV